jgi:hypothetical protein
MELYNSENVPSIPEAANYIIYTLKPTFFSGINSALSLYLPPV